VLKKWIISMDRRQDSNEASISAKTSEPSARDRHCAKSLGGSTENILKPVKNNDKSNDCDVHVTCFDILCLKMICFRIELVLYGFHLTRFDLTKGLSSVTFSIAVLYNLCHCDH